MDKQTIANYLKSIHHLDIDFLKPTIFLNKIRFDPYDAHKDFLTFSHYCNTSLEILPGKSTYVHLYHYRGSEIDRIESDDFSVTRTIRSRFITAIIGKLVQLHPNLSRDTAN